MASNLFMGGTYSPGGANSTLHSFDPGQVMMNAGGGNAPYVGTPSSTSRFNAQQNKTPAQSAPKAFLGAESVRATGSGPFDAAYRQNLATYAGGQFMRPSGGLNFNPTQPSSFPGMPTGGGNAPAIGVPQTLLGQALGGQPFVPQTPAPPLSGMQTNLLNPQNFWLDQFLNQGKYGSGGNRMMQ